MESSNAGVPIKCEPAGDIYRDSNAELIATRGNRAKLNIKYKSYKWGSLNLFSCGNVRSDG